MAMSFGYATGSEGNDRYAREKIRDMQEKIDSLESKIDLLMRMLERHFPSDNIIKELEQETRK